MQQLHFNWVSVSGVTVKYKWCSVHKQQSNFGKKEAMWLLVGEKYSDFPKLVLNGASVSKVVKEWWLLQCEYFG